MYIIDLDNQTDLAVETDILEKIALHLDADMVEVLITDNAQIQSLNREHRSKDTPTDVLSFPLNTSFDTNEMNGMPLGSIVISADLVKEKAAEFGHSHSDEFTLLFIHGLLHLLGYDHETDRGEMRAKERALVKEFNLPSSLIIRTEEF